jgi:phospholipid-translocating ATPase
LDNKELKEKFIKFSQKAPSVVCSRCSPLQKSQIVKLIKNKSNKKVAAIGDGGNDVNMIQCKIYF